MRLLRLFLFLPAFIVSITLSRANDTYNIRQISNRDGLSNSAVICLFQDTERTLWAGTYDGLNRYNGSDIVTYKPDILDSYSISGNVIRRIIESRDDYLWIVTKGGLNQYSKKRDRVEGWFGEFPENCVMACDSEGDLYIMSQTGQCSWFDFEAGQFVKVEVPGFTPKTGWVGLTIDSQDKVWVTNNGVIRQYAIVRSEAGIGFEPLGNFDHPRSIGHIFYNKGVVMIVDSADDLYLVDAGGKTFVKNIRPGIREYGALTAMVLDGQDVILGFSTGMVRLDHTDGYSVKTFPINCGVFSLLKDEEQDILWVGTDGQGIYACVKDRYIFKGINLDQLPVKTHRPVRAIFTDHRGDLWLGTKGNGIIKVRDYQNAAEYGVNNVEHITTADGLGNDAVFSFEMSRAHNVLWIGSSGPALNYYSFNDNRIRTLRTREHFAEVHSIRETSDSTIWVSSLFSLMRVDVKKNGNELEAGHVERFEFNIRNKHLFNKIYDIHQESDSIMWLAMRGNGAIRFNCLNGHYRVVTIDEHGIAPMNDVLCIHIDRNGEKWLGTSYGINNLRDKPDGGFGYRNYNENDGLANNTIHGILESRTGELWFSSNMGIILFDPVKKTFRNFNHRSGLKVIEFSDNAYYRDEAGAKYFFGGIDGVVWIEHAEKDKSDYIPPILFSKLRILNEEVNLDDLLVGGGTKKGPRLQLRHNQNFFTVLFSTNDFIDGASIKFEYMLENFNQVWMKTASREAQFTNIPPGDYVLKVRYGDEFEKESSIAALKVRILPPWYRTLIARALYVVIALSLLYMLYLYIVRKYDRKRRDMARRLDSKYKEEMYENKLRFFTNITHEFCTPLTLMYTPSERILTYEGSDDYVKKYARIIRSNTERLNTLIQEIIDFRRMETGNKTFKIESCDIGSICNDIRDAFADLAAENNIAFDLRMEEGVKWDSDRSCINTILNNLVSNAFKYTPAGGEIRISVSVEGGELRLAVYNSGKGIRQEDISRLFNRYSVLDNISENSIKSLSSRNGLGLAICKSMVELLGGDIKVNSEEGSFAEFIVSLPERTREKPVAGEVREDIAAVPGSDEKSVSPVSSVGKTSPGVVATQGDAARPRILIVDDNEEILELLEDLFADQYDVITAKDGIKGIGQVTDSMPDIILTDIMMPDQDGISMTRQIKLDPHTMHIPIVIVSARSAIDDRIEGISSGADAYVAKPFDSQYLKTIVRQLIEKHRMLRDYFNSAASSFDYMNNKLLPKEDRVFAGAVIKVIESNMADTEFTPEDLADNLGISLRSLYRRFKELELPPPKDLIKKQRIEYSARLLISTGLTIQEIMFSSGFTTRSHFHKEFTKRYGCSPREYREQRHPAGEKA